MNVHSPVGADWSVPAKTITGIPVASLAWDDAIDLLQDRIRRRGFTPIGFLNAHISNIAQRDARLMSVMKRFLVLPDGVGVDIAAKVLYAETFPANLNGTDLVPALLEATEPPLTVALLGAKSDHVEAAAAAFARKTPRHRFVVISDGYFSSFQETAILTRIADVRPDILLVALGAPRQELFIADKITSDHATLAFAVGALFDFMSGAVPRAPTWMRKTRLEWLFRLMIEPNRLWYRYVVGNPVFLFHVFSQKLRGRRGP